MRNLNPAVVNTSRLRYPICVLTPSKTSVLAPLCQAIRRQGNAALFVLLLSVAVTPFASAQAQAPTSAALKAAEATITPEHLLEHIKELSSNAYTGRHPGTPGETKSVAYITAQAKAIGLQPGNPDGTFVQRVALWGMLPQQGTLTVKGGTSEIPLTVGQDYVVWTSLPKATIDITNAGIVFAGYGVVAPEYHWDDYAGLDVHGKTVIILSGDPPVADPNDPAKLDPNMFLGNALTVYGRGGTKFDTAYKHGAAAVILLLAPNGSSPFAASRLFENYTRESMTLRGAHDQEHVSVQAVLTPDAANRLFQAAGADLDALRAAAAKPGFRGSPLRAQATLHLTSKVRQVDSDNVIAKIPGSDPSSATSTSSTPAIGTTTARSATRSTTAPAITRPEPPAYSNSPAPSAR